jgi:cytochrome P450
MDMNTFESVDFLTDLSLINDPYPYFEYLRAKAPVVRLPHRGVVAVTGYDEALAIYRDDERFSAVNSPNGPIPGLPFEPLGDDIGPQIEHYRSRMPFTDWFATMDRPAHTAHKALLMGLITPPRLKRNEEFMLRLADRQIDSLIGGSGFEAVSEFAGPFTTMIIADLLGIPEEDHRTFYENFARSHLHMGEERKAAHNPLAFLDPIFTDYIEDRRRSPRKDGLTELALGKFRDGTTPTISQIVNIATFLFAAGRDTSGRLLVAALRVLGEDPELQQQLRRERQLIPDFIEEVLRLESPVKSDFRLARVPVRVGDIRVAPGTTVMILVGAANRDPRRFERPGELRLDRRNVRDHLAFGRGIHACVGAPLARAEAKISLERLFDRTSAIAISDQKHGPRGARRFEYEPIYLLRGLRELHLNIVPAG